MGNTDGPSTPFDASKYKVCAKMCNEQLDKGKYYSCKGAIKGRHVAVARHVSAQNSQTLCEVEVYRDTVKGECLIKATFQSKTYLNVY